MPTTASGDTRSARESEDGEATRRDPDGIQVRLGSDEERLGDGLEVLVAGAGGAAHLAGVAAAHTTLPVLGVPMESASLKGLDSLLSTAQMPGGIPVATFAIGKPGAVNAALFAVAVLAGKRPELSQKLAQFRAD